MNSKLKWINYDLKDLNPDWQLQLRAKFLRFNKMDKILSYKLNKLIV